MNYAWLDCESLDRVSWTSTTPDKEADEEFHSAKSGACRYT